MRRARASETWSAEVEATWRGCQPPVSPVAGVSVIGYTAAILATLFIRTEAVPGARRDAQHAASDLVAVRDEFMKPGRVVVYLPDFDLVGSLPQRQLA